MALVGMFPVLPIVSIGLFLNAFNVMVLSVYFFVHKTRPGQVTMLLLVFKFLRMFLFLMALVLYSLVTRESLSIVYFCLFAYYLIVLIHNSIFYVRLEYRLKGIV